MMVMYVRAESSDIEKIFNLNKELIDKYEDTEQIEYEKVLIWVRRKIEESIEEYTKIKLNNNTVGYYHFFKNGDKMELDDLYIFPEYQNRGIGTAVLEKCISGTERPIFLYVFSRNSRAIKLYERMGFAIVENIGKNRYIMQRSC